MQGGAPLRRNGARRVVTGRRLTYNRSQSSTGPQSARQARRYRTCRGAIRAVAHGDRAARYAAYPGCAATIPPDLEELLRRSQDKLRTVLPGGNLGGKGVLLLILAALVVWGISGFYRVDTNEYGIVLRFGAFNREAGPGLNYHLPYPIETALTPQVTVVRQIHIGMRQVDDLRRGSTIRDVPEESLMLTGDENIVDVDFTVFWQVKKDKVSDFLFNIQQVENSVKAVAEAAMREVVGRTSIQPILTGARAGI